MSDQTGIEKAVNASFGDKLKLASEIVNWFGWFLIFRGFYVMFKNWRTNKKLKKFYAESDESDYSINHYNW